MEWLITGIILTSFVILGSSQLASSIRMVALQGALLSILPTMARSSFADPHSLLLFIGAFTIKAVVIPIFLFRSLKQAKIRKEVEPIVSLHLSPRPSAFTDIQLHLPLPSYSELVAILLEKSKLAPSADAATNLIKGIYQSTQNLSSRKLSADTFSCLAFLMRAGGSLPGQASFIGKLTPPPFFEPPLLAPQLNPAGLQDDTDNVGPVPTDWKKPKIFKSGQSVIQ